MMNKITIVVFSLFLLTNARAQSNAATEPPKKANARATVETPAAEPFDGASVEKMAAQCVTLDTDLGAIDIAMMPEVAPESVRKIGRAHV